MLNDPEESHVRSHEVFVEVDASREAVWKAVADAEELKRWFPLDARIRPGKGGSLWLAWGPGFEMEQPITEWTEGKHYRCESPAEGNNGRKIAVDYYIETRSGKTVLRIVTSFFGSGSWDDEFDGMQLGWSWFVQALRHALDRRGGLVRCATWLGTMEPQGRPAAWSKLTGPTGFPGDSARESAMKPGAPFEVTLGDDTRLRGKLLIHKPGCGFGGVLESHDEALFFLEVGPCGEAAMPSVLVSTFGKPQPALHAAVAATFRRAYPDAAFGAEQVLNRG
ncbi:MAG: SRPBCC domain-containing protein [Planctomycetes bacterium]|nr:SRPBCC domain-containing protein [Planctomycetota bacterium]